MTLYNSWPYWHARFLKQINSLGITILYDVDSDNFITLELAENIIEKEGGKDESDYMIDRDNLFFGKIETIGNIFEAIRNKTLPIPPDNISKIIKENEENDPILKALKKIKIGEVETEKKVRKPSQIREYITDVDKIMKNLRENTDNSKCFNLVSGNLVNKSGPVIYNENEHIPLCLPKGYKGSDSIFKEIESKIEQSYEVGKKTTLISDEEAKEMGLISTIPSTFSVDVKREISIPTPKNVNVAEILKRFSTVLEK